MSVSQARRLARLETVLTQHITRAQWERLLMIVDAAMGEALAQLGLPADQQARLRAQAFSQWRERAGTLPVLIPDRQMNAMLGWISETLETSIRPELEEPQFRLFAQIMSEQFAQYLRTKGESL